MLGGRERSIYAVGVGMGSGGSISYCYFGEEKQAFLDGVGASTFKGTLRPDWICMSVVSLESTLKGHQPLYVFNVFIFDLEYFIRVQSSEPLHAKMNQISCLFGSRFA